MAFFLNWPNFIVYLLRFQPLAQKQHKKVAIKSKPEQMLLFYVNVNLLFIRLS